jgi:hypothetical protein
VLIFTYVPVLPTENLGAFRQSEKDIEIKHEHNRSILIRAFLSACSGVDVNMIDEDAVPDTILLIDLVRWLLGLSDLVIFNKPARG